MPHQPATHDHGHAAAHTAAAVAWRFGIALPLLFAASATPCDRAHAQAEWTTPAGTVQGTRFSSLAEINTTNVGSLKEEFSFATGSKSGFEGAPLVVGNTMYVVGPFPNKLFALDLTRPGHTRFVFDPHADPFAQDKACCDVVNRGAVFGRERQDHLQRARQHHRRRRCDDRARGLAYQASAIRRPGRPSPWRRWSSATTCSSATAAARWASAASSWRSTSPPARRCGAPSAPARTADVQIGPGFHAFYPKDNGTNLGTTTWPGTLWQRGGSTVWAWLTYDPALNLLYYGTANPGVWDADMRPGDNKWSTTIFARNPATGDAAWAYQVTPHDAWDYDGVNENIVADLTINGDAAQVIWSISTATASPTRWTARPARF